MFTSGNSSLTGRTPTPFKFTFEILRMRLESSIAVVLKYFYHILGHCQEYKLDVAHCKRSRPARFSKFPL